MKEHIKERTLMCAKHIVETGETIRVTAQRYGVSKSTLHADLSIRLELLDKFLYKQVEKILKIHFSEKHIRGGIATKNKYKKN